MFGFDLKKLSKTAQAPYYRIRNRGVFEEPEEIRFYPNQTLAAHVLGYVQEKRETNAAGSTTTTMAGSDGVERTLNHILAGIAR